MGEIVSCVVGLSEGLDVVIDSIDGLDDGSFEEIDLEDGSFEEIDGVDHSSGVVYGKNAFAEELTLRNFFLIRRFFSIMANAFLSAKRSARDITKNGW